VNIASERLKRVRLGGRTYKNHLDGYDQMDLLTGQGRPNGTRSSTLADHALVHFV
jgi:hypothetical protein